MWIALVSFVWVSDLKYQKRAAEAEGPDTTGKGTPVLQKLRCFLFIVESIQPPSSYPSPVYYISFVGCNAFINLY